VLLLLLTPLAWAQVQEQAVDLDDSRIDLPVAGTVEALKLQALYRPIDTSGSDQAALFRGDGFGALDPDWETSAPPLWLRLHLSSPEQARNDWLLLVQRRFFRTMEVQVLDPSSGHIVRYSLGTDDYDPVQIAARDYILPLGLAPGQERIVLMKVDTLQRSLSALDFVLQDELTFDRDQNTRFWAFGLYFGSVIALLIYNLTLYLNLRTPGHRMYVIAIGAVLVMMGLDSGLLQSTLPMAMRERELLYLATAAALVMAASIRFFQVFASAKSLVPRLNWLLNGFNIWIIASALLALFSPVAWSIWIAPLVQLSISLATVVLLGTSILGAVRGSNASLIFFIAWAAFLTGSLLRTLLGFEFLPRLAIAEYVIYIGSVMEAMILALGLSYRVGQLRMQRNRAEREQLKAMALANKDSLTGAYNRRFFDSYLAGLLQPEDGKAPRGALILLDIDHFKDTNDDHGHDAGDTVLQALTKRCQNELRSTDVLCRLGGDEFAVILGSVEEESAFQVAERLHRRVSRSPVMHQGQFIDVKISVGVLSTLQSDMDQTAALRAADHALYAAKHAGRDQVKSYTGSEQESTS
ncbi:MAG: diguanylate cyclase, partial [Pseudomonadota bacterium]